MAVGVFAHMPELGGNARAQQEGRLERQRLRLLDQLIEIGRRFESIETPLLLGLPGDKPITWASVIAPEPPVEGTSGMLLRHSAGATPRRLLSVR